MTTLGIFSIYDQKAKAYLQPFFSLNEDTATRELTNAVNGDGDFNQFSEDYTLFGLGTFDQSTGQFDLEDQAFLICNAATLKKSAILTQINTPEALHEQMQAELTKETTPNV